MPVEIEHEKQWRWLDVEPSEWHYTIGWDPQYCGACGFSMIRTFITNARGSWEHFECAKKAYNAHHAKNSGIEKHGTQRDMIVTLQRAGQLHIVKFDLLANRDSRYSWKVR